MTITSTLLCKYVSRFIVFDFFPDNEKAWVNSIVKILLSVGAALVYVFRDHPNPYSVLSGKKYVYKKI